MNPAAMAATQEELQSSQGLTGLLASEPVRLRGPNRAFNSGTEAYSGYSFDAPFGWGQHQMQGQAVTGFRALAQAWVPFWGRQTVGLGWLVDLLVRNGKN